jgi:protein involved in polysaccharide export with SLBB domain
LKPVRGLSLAVTVLASSLLLSACVGRGIQEIPDQPAVLSPDLDFQIGRGDQLSVKFFYTEELNEDIVVRPDGKISLQLVGEIEAAGKTPGELSELLKQKYSRVLSKPEVVVILRYSASHRAYVGGEVAQPKMVALDGRTTIADAVFAAGGAKTTAALDSVILVRQTEAGREAYRVDLEDAFFARAPLPVLQPYDLVYVPKSFIAQVGDFVDLYINRILPRSVSFTTFYNINPNAKVP